MFTESPYFFGQFLIVFGCLLTYNLTEFWELNINIPNFMDQIRKKLVLNFRIEISRIYHCGGGGADFPSNVAKIRSKKWFSNRETGFSQRIYQISIILLLKCTERNIDTQCEKKWICSKIGCTWNVCLNKNKKPFSLPGKIFF